jgi:hypothetical protein
MSNELYGWTSPPEDCSNPYIERCKLFSRDESEFLKFRQDPVYRKILEGWDDGGELWLSDIVSRYGVNDIIKYYPKFKKNDIHCSPTIRNYPYIGDACPFTIKYAMNALDIKNVIPETRFKRIVEVGGGFGSMCLVMDGIHNFESYTIIDLPDVIALTDKYLSLFPEVRSRVDLIPCNDFKKIESCSEFDLFISDSGMAECDLSTQKLYTDQLLHKSRFGYVVYNTLHQEEQRIAYQKLLSSSQDKYEVSGFARGGIPVLFFVSR